MCCIAACISTPLSTNLLERITDYNQDGVGISWINQNGNVEWFKSKNYKAIIPLLNDVPLPYFIHARMATIGGDKLSLVHPFPIEAYPRTAMAGTAKAVFAHNGHIPEWDAFMCLVDPNLVIRKNEWSDSRGIAHILARQGNSVLLKKLQDSNRFVILSKKGLKMYGNWIKEEDGLFLSSPVNGPLYRYKWSDFTMDFSKKD